MFSKVNANIILDKIEKKYSCKNASDDIFHADSVSCQN